MRKRAFTLIELLVGLVVFGLVMAGAFVAFIEMWNAAGASVGLPGSQQGAEAIAFKLAESFQQATLCTTTDSGCVLNSGIENATSSGVTIYSRNSSGTLVKTVFANNSGNYQMTTGGSTLTLASNATVNLTYYTSSSYNATALTTFTPTSSNESTLIAVGIQVNVAQGGGNNTYNLFVRLRNGP